MLIHFLIFLSLIMSSLVVTAQNTDAIKSIDALNQKIIQDPSQAINYFNLGVIYQKNNDTKNALMNYNKVIELKSPLTPAATYYKARIYDTTGNKLKAKELLNSINLDTVPAQLKENILSLKEKISSEQKRISLYADINQGSIYNPASYASQYSSAITTESQTLLKAGFDFLAFYSTDYDIKLNYFYSQTSLSKTTSLNYAYNDINLPFAFYFSDSRIRINAEYFTDSYSSSIYSEQKGIAADYAYKIKDNYLSFLIQRNDINNKTTTYSYLTGQQTKLQLSYEQKYSASKINYRGYFSNYKYEDTTTLASSYFSFGLNLGYNQQFDFLDIFISATAEQKNYKNATATSLARKDQKYSGTGQLGYSVASYFRIYIEGTYIDNQSNYSTTANDLSYKQNTFALGLSASY